MKKYQISILIDNYFKTPTFTAATPDDAKKQLFEILKSYGWENKEYTITNVTEIKEG